MPVWHRLACIVMSTFIDPTTSRGLGGACAAAAWHWPPSALPQPGCCCCPQQVLSRWLVRQAARQKMTDGCVRRPIMACTMETFGQPNGGLSGLIDGLSRLKTGPWEPNAVKRGLTTPSPENPQTQRKSARVHRFAARGLSTNPATHFQSWQGGSGRYCSRWRCCWSCRPPPSRLGRREARR